MKNPPLRLDRHFFPKVIIEADPGFGAVRGKPSEISVDSRVELKRHNKDIRKWQVVLSIKVGSEKEHPVPYRIELEAVGFFEVAEDVPNEAAGTIIHNNGASILYSSAREFLLTMTGRGPWGPFCLPTVTFMVQPAQPPSVKMPVPKHIRKAHRH